MGEVIEISQKVSEKNKISTEYKDDIFNDKWFYTNKRFFWDDNGYNSNKCTNAEYNFKGIKKEEVSSNMDDNKLLEKYMDSVSQNIREMEERNIQDKREREQRIEECQKLSEERMEKKFVEAMGAIKNQNDIINETKIKIDDKYENLKWWILGTSIAIILSFVAIILSIILPIK